MSGTSVRLFRPGQIDYESALAWQQRAAGELRDGLGCEQLALLQHPPTYTRGRRTRPEHLLASAAEIERRGARVVDVDRGGDVTFHGPGQLVAYPILDLRGRSLLPGDYVRMLEQTAIDALGCFGVSGERVSGRPGVWTRSGKIVAIGVRVHQGVSTHGFAMNVSTDLDWFDAIVPCGIADTPVTSMATVLGTAPRLEDLEDAVMTAFERIFACTLADVDLFDQLGAPTEGAALAR